MKLLDRLTEETIDTRQLASMGTITAQRYVLQEDWEYQGKKNIPQGSIFCGDGSATMAIDGENRLHCTESILSETACSAITQIAQTMCDYLRQNDFNKNLPSPLIPVKIFNESSHENTVEKMLSTVLEEGHFHQICCRPRIDMRYDEEMVPVSRAKKIANTAHRHLAMHSETWQQRSFTGVYPRKILARLSEDEWVIYENRVFARLLDKLQRFLKNRHSVLLEQKQNIENALSLEDSKELYFKYRNDLCELWAENLTIEQSIIALDQIEKSIGSIDKLLSTLRNLKSFGLYLKVPRSAQVPDQIHMTNILAHDQNYRHVAHLWNELSISKKNNSGDLDEMRRLYMFQEDYHQYSLLIILRSFNSLGYKCAVKEDGSFYLTRNVFSVELRSDLKSKCWKLYTKHSTSPLKIIGITHPITPDFSRELKFEKSTFIFYLSNPIEGEESNIPQSAFVSPLNFESVENFTKFLTKWLYLGIFKGYAEDVDLGRVPQSLKSELLKIPALKEVESHYFLLEKLSDSEIDAVERACDAANTPHILERISLKNEHLIKIQNCPLCAASVQFQRREDSKTFTAECSNSQCGVFYELRVDRDKNRRFILRPPSISENCKAGRWSWSFGLNESE
jgi:hypothetical protein